MSDIYTHIGTTSDDLTITLDMGELFQIIMREFGVEAMLDAMTAEYGCEADIQNWVAENINSGHIDRIVLDACPMCGHHGSNNDDNAVVRIEHKAIAEAGQYRVVCDFSRGGCGASGGWRTLKHEGIATWNSRAAI